MEHWELINRGKILASDTPQELWQQACAYFQWCDTNPIVTKRTATAGKETGKKHEVESTRPYSIKGLCLHCGILEEYLRDIRKSKREDSEYYHVVSTILYLIFVQNLEYATIGVFNPIFTAKMLGMEKDETPVGAIRVEVVHGIPELSKSENEVLEKLELENLKNQNSEDEDFQR